MAAIEFWPHTTNADVASFRLRCLRVQTMLQERGVDAGRFAQGGKPRILVLSKRYDPSTLQQAVALRARAGTRLLLDICDNHFHFARADAVVQQRARHLRDAIRAVDGVVASSDYLRGVIKAEVAAPPPITVIGDLVDMPHLPGIGERLAHPVSWRYSARLRTQLGRIGVDVATRLVWFGHHGSDYVEGGMNDIRRILPDLEAQHMRQPLSLTVVSNSRQKFEAIAAQTRVPMLYAPWSRSFISPMLMAHAVCVIPITANPFTLAKTDNRLATALVHGLRVVADNIPSYRAHQEHVFLGEWRSGLQRAVAQGPAAGPLLDASGANARVLDQWQAALTVH